jgi:hypothetical protein
MKDYSQQILAILASNLKPETSKDANEGIPGLSGVSKSVHQINLMIRNEVSRLEAELVNLNDQLLETDSLLYQTRKKPSRKAIYPVERQKKDKTYPTSRFI